MTEKFKGDARELQYEGAGAPAFDRTTATLDAFLADAYNSAPWLLMLYDEKRMPFSERIARNAFVAFIREALSRFPFTGSFDSYLFVLRAIFGSNSYINFTVTAPGKLKIEVDATSGLEFNFLFKEIIDGEVVLSHATDSFGNELLFRGIAGIETEYELELLFSELMPAGIVPDISLSFFERSPMISWNSGPTVYNVTDMSGNRIIFWQIGV